MPFPSITTHDLNRREVTLPSGLEGEYNLLLLGYQRWHQEQYKTWLPFAARVENANPAFRHYELPVVGRMNPVGRFFLDEGMRAGIPGREARERVFTLYVDLAALNRQLGIASTQEITLLLVRRDGAILWRETGAWTAEKGTSLEEALRATESPATAGSG
jgi:hypothetical protein